MRKTKPKFLTQNNSVYTENVSENNLVHTENLAETVAPVTGLPNEFGSLEARMARRPKLNSPPPSAPETAPDDNAGDTEKYTENPTEKVGKVIDFATGKESAGVEPGTSETGENTNVSAEFDETEYNEFVGKAEETFADWLGEDLEQAGEVIIGFWNTVRMFLMPLLYKKIIGFTEDELKEIAELKKRKAEAEKLKIDAEFTDSEQELLSLFSDLQKAQANASYTPENIKQFSKIIARKLKDVPVPLLVKKYDWLIFLAYLEWKAGGKIFMAGGKRKAAQMLGL